MRMPLNETHIPEQAERDASKTDSLFSRAGIRHEVALDVLGSLIAHYAELLGIERSRAVPDDAVVRQAEAIQRYLRHTRNELNPKNATEIESTIARYAPLARRLYADPQTASDPLAERAAWFRQANASLAREGRAVDDADLALQAQVILGVLSSEEAIERYRRPACRNQA